MRCLKEQGAIITILGNICQYICKKRKVTVAQNEQSYVERALRVLSLPTGISIDTWFCFVFLSRRNN